MISNSTPRYVPKESRMMFKAKLVYEFSQQDSIVHNSPQSKIKQRKEIKEEKSMKLKQKSNREKFSYKGWFFETTNKTVSFWPRLLKKKEKHKLRISRTEEVTEVLQALKGQ